MSVESVWDSGCCCSAFDWGDWVELSDVESVEERGEALLFPAKPRTIGDWETRKRGLEPQLRSVVPTGKQHPAGDRDGAAQMVVPV